MLGFPPMALSVVPTESAARGRSLLWSAALLQLILAIPRIGLAFVKCGRTAQEMSTFELTHAAPPGAASAAISHGFDQHAVVDLIWSRQRPEYLLTDGLIWDVILGYWGISALRPSLPDGMDLNCLLVWGLACRWKVIFDIIRLIVLCVLGVPLVVFPLCNGFLDIIYWDSRGPRHNFSSSSLNNTGPPPTSGTKVTLSVPCGLYNFAVFLRLAPILAQLASGLVVAKVSDEVTDRDETFLREYLRQQEVLYGSVDGNGIVNGIDGNNNGINGSSSVPILAGSGLEPGQTQNAMTGLAHRLGDDSNTDSRGASDEESLLMTSRKGDGVHIKYATNTTGSYEKSNSNVPAAGPGPYNTVSSKSGSKQQPHTAVKMSSPRGGLPGTPSHPPPSPKLIPSPRHNSPHPHRPSPGNGGGNSGSSPRRNGNGGGRAGRRRRRGGNGGGDMNGNSPLNGNSPNHRNGNVNQQQQSIAPETAGFHSFLGKGQKLSMEESDKDDKNNEGPEKDGGPGSSKKE